MRKVCIASLVILMAVAYIPSAPAQLPMSTVLCTVPGDGTYTGSHTGTSSYNAPSSNANVRVFDFCGSAGDAINFYVDNVNTPSDVWACVVATLTSPCVPSFYNAIMSDLGGDDESPCTVPHTFACPAGQAPLPADGNGDGVYHVRVGTWAAPGNFAGTISVNGAPVLVLPHLV